MGDVGRKGVLHWVYNAVRLILGGLFLYAGISKLSAPTEFAVIINSFGLVPSYTAGILSVLIPALEIVAAVLLIFHVAGGLRLTFFQLLFFIGILTWGIHLGLDIDCGCFGPDDSEGQFYHSMRTAIVRDVVMVGGILFCAWYRRRWGVSPRKFSFVDK